MTGVYPLPRGTRIDTNDALKATTLTTILNVKGQGFLKGISIKDPDDLTQSERIQVSIDGRVIINCTTIDPGTAFIYMNMIASALNEAWVAAAVGAGGECSIQNPLPFKERLKVEYLRAAAGTTGLSINILFSITETGKETVA